jgi:hypothetical protein
MTPIFHGIGDHAIDSYRSTLFMSPSGFKQEEMLAPLAKTLYS